MHRPKPRSRKASKAQENLDPETDYLNLIDELGSMSVDKWVKREPDVHAPLRNHRNMVSVPMLVYKDETPLIEEKKVELSNEQKEEDLKVEGAIDHSGKKLSEKPSCGDAKGKDSIQFSESPSFPNFGATKNEDHTPVIQEIPGFPFFQSKEESTSDAEPKQEIQLLLETSELSSKRLKDFVPLHDRFYDEMKDLAKSANFIAIGKIFSKISIESNSSEIAASLAQILVPASQEDRERCKLFAVQITDRIIESGPTRVERVERNSPNRAKYAYVFAEIVAFLVDDYPQLEFMLDIMMGHFHHVCKMSMVRTNSGSETLSKSSLQRLTGYLSIFAAFMVSCKRLGFSYSWCWIQTLCSQKFDPVAVRVAVDIFFSIAIPKIYQYHPRIAKETILPLLPIVSGLEDMDSLGIRATLREYLGIAGIN